MRTLRSVGRVSSLGSVAGARAVAAPAVAAAAAGGTAAAVAAAAGGAGRLFLPAGAAAAEAAAAAAAAFFFSSSSFFFFSSSFFFFSASFFFFSASAVAFCFFTARRLRAQHSYATRKPRTMMERPPSTTATRRSGVLGSAGASASACATAAGGAHRTSRVASGHASFGGETEDADIAVESDGSGARAAAGGGVSAQAALIFFLAASCPPPSIFWSPTRQRALRPDRPRWTGCASGPSARTAT